MAKFEFKTPSAEEHWQKLVDRHGKNTVHDLFSIPENHDKVVVRHREQPDRSRDLEVTSYVYPSKETGHGHMNSTRTLTSYDHLFNDLNNIKGHPSGTGTKAFARQVLAARKMEILSIEIESAVSGDGYNGGYTWPRLGFNGPLRDFVKKHFPGHHDMHGVFSTEEGAQKWKDLGHSTFNLEFDTHPDSEHSKRLLQYMKSKGLLA